MESCWVWSIARLCTMLLQPLAVWPLPVPPPSPLPRSLHWAQAPAIMDFFLFPRCARLLLGFCSCCSHCLRYFHAWLLTRTSPEKPSLTILFSNSPPNQVLKARIEKSPQRGRSAAFCIVANRLSALPPQLLLILPCFIFFIDINLI